jgi:hypothetical protein
MQIAGTIRANLRAAIASAKRQRGRSVHGDTITHWHRLLEYSRRIDRHPSSEPVSDLIAELETEMDRRQAH